MRPRLPPFGLAQKEQERAHVGLNFLRTPDPYTARNACPIVLGWDRTRGVGLGGGGGLDSGDRRCFNCVVGGWAVGGGFGEAGLIKRRQWDGVEGEKSLCCCQSKARRARLQWVELMMVRSVFFF